MQRRWIFPSTEGDLAVGHMSRQLDIPDFVARVLIRNGLGDFGAATSFLQPRLRQLEDPFLLPEMEQAVGRIRHAIESSEEIVLYGDYDVDGVASLALLQRILTAFGARVNCFLPLRAEEGYGLSPSGVARCFEECPPKLLIAVDCGTNSAREVAMIRERGADVIILDHHEVSGERPRCAALVNPKTDRKFHYLCSAGVAFKVAHALLKQVPNANIDLKDYLDIVALATLADLVPLIGENRILVHRGLQQMARTRWPGLTALMTIANVRSPLHGSDVGFRLGPRINASGRLGTALESLRLLLCDDIRDATQIADSLDRQNRARQSVERELIREVDQWVEEHYDAAIHASIVAGRREWHHGVLGIVAARIMRRHHRPTLLVGFDDGGLGKGSGRSIEGLSLVDALRQCAGHLEKFGGHEMAAGVTVQQDRFEDFRRAFEISTRERVNDEILTPKLRLDAELPMEDISLSVLEMQELLEPYGMGNSQPVFAARTVTPVAAPRILKERHLRLDFRAGRRLVQAIYFRGAEEALPRPPWDVAFTIERNEFNGRLDAQMQIVAIRPAASLG
ncbi:MAG TPA: single-stranded-DNA-specific exonuclease RecJ [Terrimicrobiaceae bacterium]